MPVPRMKMRPWLEEKIESNTVPGLGWLDKEEGIFSISWKHGARHGWEVEKDASLFKLWAIHTGKYIEGKTAADPRMWKANFRCAINSLPDIKEVKEQSVNKGHMALRVYKMLPVAPKDKNKTKAMKLASKRGLIKAEQMHLSDHQSLLEQQTQVREEVPLVQENTVDSTGQQDVTCESADEVPEWSTMVEISMESSHPLFPHLQISPEHSIEYDESGEGDIIQIAEQWEMEQHRLNGSPFTETLNPENTPDSCSSSSPTSQWSDTASVAVEDMDTKLYANLTPGIVMAVDDLMSSGYTDSWNSHHSVLLQPIPCSL